MKKSILAAAIFAAISSQAASFNWGSGTSAVAFDGTTLAGNATAYLVFLGNGSGSVADLWSTTSEAIVGADAVKSDVTSTAKRTAGRVSSSYGDASTNIQNGDRFGVYLTYNDGTDTWYNFSQTIYTVSGISLGNEALETATFAFDFATKSDIDPAVASPSAGGGWYRAVPAVPEPSTAALAIAGLALLIKRRKA